MSKNDDLKIYYARRAAEYEDIYRKPERLADVQRLREILGEVFSGRDVLEIACGTGYWTQIIAQSAKSILATDCNAKVLDIARQKNYGECTVRFDQADAFAPAEVDRLFDAAFCGFWWSHIAKTERLTFLSVLHDKLASDALVVMIDNRYVEGSSTPFSRTDAEGNTYQMRKLADGSRHEILKNFPAPDEIIRTLANFAAGLEITELQYYWVVQYIITQKLENRPRK